MYPFSRTKQFISIFLCAPLSALYLHAADSPQATAIDYATALRRAIANDPVLEGFSARYEATEGQIEQAGLRPNPTVGLEMENFAGTDAFSDIQGVEVTLGLSQVMETAGKRTKRAELARTGRAVLDWERELRLAALTNQVRTAFVEVLLAQKAVALSEEQLILAQNSASETQRLIEAGLVTDAEGGRARLAVSEQRFAIRQARNRLERARAHLSALWGETSPGDYVVTGEVSIEPDLPEWDALIAALPETVHLAGYDALRRQKDAAVKLEQARAKPNFELFGGPRYFNEGSGDAALVVGVEIPWTLFDKNQGNIRTARAERLQVDFEAATRRRELVVALQDAYQKLQAARQEARSIENDLLPSAEATLEATQQGYERGLYTLLAVLDSRNALFRIRTLQLEAIRQYAEAQASIEALTRPAQTKQN